MNKNSLKNLQIITSLMVISLTFQGCASTTLVIPREKNQYEVIAYHEYESEALKAALAKAKKTCAKTDQNFKVIDKAITYHGVLTQEANKIARNAKHALEDMTGQIVPSTSTTEDYKANLKIECVAS